MKNDNEIYEFSVQTVLRNVYGLSFLIIISVFLTMFGLSLFILLPVLALFLFFSYWSLKHVGDIQADSESIKVFAPLQSYVISWENIQSIDLDVGGYWIAKGKNGKKLLMPASLPITRLAQHQFHPCLDIHKKLLGEFVYKKCQEYGIPLGTATPYSSYLGAKN